MPVMRLRMWPDNFMPTCLALTNTGGSLLFHAMQVRIARALDELFADLQVCDWTGL